MLLSDTTRCTFPLCRSHEATRTIRKLEAQAPEALLPRDHRHGLLLRGGLALEEGHGPGQGHGVDPEGLEHLGSPSRSLRQYSANADTRENILADQKEKNNSEKEDFISQFH